MTNLYCINCKSIQEMEYVGTLKSLNPSKSVYNPSYPRFKCKKCHFEQYVTDSEFKIALSDMRKENIKLFPNLFKEPEKKH
jgi:hypothetical protein